MPAWRLRLPEQPLARHHRLPGELHPAGEKIIPFYSPFKTQKTMKKYVCDVCGYIYDPAVGDPDNGIAPGTAFEDIPDD